MIINQTINKKSLNQKFHAFRFQDKTIIIDAEKLVGLINIEDKESHFHLSFNYEINDEFSKELFSIDFNLKEVKSNYIEYLNKLFEEEFKENKLETYYNFDGIFQIFFDMSNFKSSFRNRILSDLQVDHVINIDLIKRKIEKILKQN